MTELLPSKVYLFTHNTNLNSYMSYYRSFAKKWRAKIDIILQSTLVISKSKGPSKTVRDIRTSTYQICSIEENTI